MKLKTKILYFLFNLFSIFSFGQNENSKMIPILPHWEINDVHKLKLRFSEKDIIKRKSTECVIDFEASFKVLEKNEKYYLLSWTFDNVKFAKGKLNKEMTIVSKLLHNEILIKFNGFGEYIEIVNDEAVRLSANKVIENLIAKETDPTGKIDLNFTKQLIKTKQGLETSLLKSVKIFFLPFGHQYPMNQEMTHNLKYPNLLGGDEPFDAVEKVCLSIANSNDKFCVIEANQIIDTNQFLKEYKTFLKEKLNYKNDYIENLIRNNTTSVQENLIHFINLQKGNLLKLIFKRVINLSMLTKIVGYEIDTINL